LTVHSLKNKDIDGQKNTGELPPGAWIKLCPL